jgi:hypothetical protein
MKFQNDKRQRFGILGVSLGIENWVLDINDPEFDYHYRINCCNF